MGIMDFFASVPTIAVAEARRLLAAPDAAGRYNLVDVRQPKEYAAQHLPGAQLLPLGELKDRLAELDSAKPTITYCRSGVRSRSAATLLLAAGFTEVFSLAGGIKTWEGGVATGEPEVGMAHFAGAESLAELVALSIGLEEGSRRFYQGVAELLEPDDRDSAALFKALAGDEVRHQQRLRLAYAEETGQELDTAQLAGRFGDAVSGVTMEGGIGVAEGVSWARGRNRVEILEVAMALELNAYDLYLKMGPRFTASGGREIFRQLANEEQAHLRSLSERLEMSV